MAGTSPAMTEKRLIRLFIGDKKSPALLPGFYSVIRSRVPHMVSVHP
jgi:hypothetical protein